MVHSLPGMRSPVRLSVLAVVSALVAVVAPLAPAQAASGEWVVEAEPSASADVRYFMHKRVEGHSGNWHILNVNLREDDDGVTGGLTSLRCPKGVQPDPVAGWAGCTEVAGADFVDELGLSVTYTRQLRFIHISGDIVLNDYFNGEIVQTSMDVRILASGERTRTVTRQSFTEPDPWDFKQIDVARDGVTLRGQVAWLKASPTPVTFTKPLRAYWTFTRGYADGV